MSRNGHTITTTRIHIMALDGIVNVNSLFTLALFLGLSWYPTAPDPTATLVTDTSCDASSSIAEDLIAFHVYSFSSFLFSSLIASAVKQTIKRFDNHKDDDSVGSVRSAPLAHVNLAALRAGTLVSGFGSVFGCGFLMMALMDLVQIKLGVLGCGNLHTFAAVIPLGVGSDKGVKFVRLHYSNESRKSMQPSKYLKIALFVKKWPHRSLAGGLERHALTLHLALAKRGHELHIFTTSPSNSSFPRYPMSNLYFHLSKPTAAGYLDQAFVWKQFQTQNSTGKAFDIVHTESVGLFAYSVTEPDQLSELLRNPDEQQSYALTERITKVVEEVRFFPHYAHHVATSDHAGDILRRIYMIPEERVHVILNGVDEEIFKPDPAKGEAFKQKFGVSKSRSLVIGMAGRLVKDKGHPLMFEALRQMFVENGTFRQNTIVLIAGDGPWGARYRDLGANTLVLGPLEQAQLASFYNAIDIFVNPTLRAQGLDHTLLEAMLSGKSVMSTRVASITGSVIVSTETGYTFSPVVASLKNALYRVWEDGRRVLELKGQASRQRGLQLFTATKMTAAYERLFLCISNDNSKREDYCRYQSPFN
ncbi:hypothetical protein OIU77_028296 [Salix suchowensis]|uniref:Glycosyltransferase subfamily 4-like N-terminal domain-containing protein n=1 Tax=Salix suchowensis TaxID=1278906 RepID=A0ABQ9BGX7_9ROSI|nr:hypothetical protein OIU77_028296 [Salix suchowensis]